MPETKFTVWVTADDEGTVTDMVWVPHAREEQKKPHIVRRLPREVTELVRSAARSEEAAVRYLHYLRECAKMGLRVATPGSGDRNYINVWHTDDRTYRAACLTVGSGRLHIPYATEAQSLEEWTAVTAVQAVTNNGELTTGVKIYLNDEWRVDHAIEMTSKVKDIRYSDSGDS